MNRFSLTKLHDVEAGEQNQAKFSNRFGPLENLATVWTQTWFLIRENINITGKESKYCFYYWWGWTKSLGTAATSGLLYNPR
jgi:hypothetical protein